MRVKDKVTVITGAGAGIGRATAVLFGREGAILHLSDIDAKGLRETCRQIPADKGRVSSSRLEIFSTPAAVTT